ncbi:MAG: chromosome segregation protein SMC [Nitrospira sp.]|nr:chromosome segregation protein SMC [Nitrospira sp.]MDH4370574.1 chromosome segregation protein SMC [Nitrospira sp.]MDH5346815.1 chromosome segregation protein SMC [Nitrospira sp.]MDH5497089.1 chromosome segregation protein SMC [Nitrospira sp.]MDH5724126.1 chromosome segregation protein SMC [Nitrospira sp.]
MHLKSLNMLGFKSFAEAKIAFPEGVTAVVGPNGSGKSNVVDAILWVLGEQSTKTLRSEKMEDVIFNGTEVRKPLGMAEVSLVIGGLDQAAMKLDGNSGLPSELTEVQELMITRRLYRNGESEYLINKIHCRLKDIRSLLLDTRAGSKGHTVIAQGQIDQILNASPQDRRELIEETAGIVRYKKQKAEALRKLEATQQNLLRVRDIVAEVKKQLNSLERQARQARTYQTLQGEAREIEVILLTREFRTLRQTLQEVESEVLNLDQQESEKAAEQARFTTELEQARLDAIATADSIGKIREELAGVEQQQAHALTAAEVERNRGQLFSQQQVQESAELEELVRSQEQVVDTLQTIESSLVRLEEDVTLRNQALEELDREMTQLLDQRAAAVAEEERGRKDVLQLAVLVANTEQSISQLGQRMEGFTNRASRLTMERDELQDQRESLIARHETLREEYGNADRLVATLQADQRTVKEEVAQAVGLMQSLDQVILRRSEELAGLESRLEALQSVVREEMGYGRQGADQGPALKSCEGVRDAVAEWLLIPSGMERAVEAVLGERVRGWFVDEPSVGRRLIQFLQEETLGRGSFIPQHPRWAGGQVHDWWSVIATEPEVVGRAVDLIQTDADRTVARDSLFDRVVIVRSLDHALQLWERHAWSAPTGPILVTLEGDVVDASGIVTGGQVQGTPGLLERRREVLDLETKRQVLVMELDQNKQQREIVYAQIQELTERDRQLGDSLREAEMQNLSLRKDEEKLQHVLTDLDHRLNAVEAEIQEGLSEREQLEQESQSVQAQLGQWIAEKIGHDTLLSRVREGLGLLDQNLRTHQERVTEARLAAEGLRAKREHEQLNRARVTQQIQETEDRRRVLGEHLDSLKGLIEQSQTEQTRQEALCRELGVTAGQVKENLVAAQERHAHQTGASQALESSLDQSRRGMSAIRDARMTIEVRRAEIRMQLGTVESTLSGTYQLDPLTLVDVSAGSSEPTVMADAAPEPETVEWSDPELKEQLQKLRDRLDRMGPINLAAISEHQELEERHTFLSAQEQDLSNSITSLKEIIQRIHRTTKEMFAATYDELQQKFTEVFSQFFPGGRAELQLVEEASSENGEPSGSEEPGIEIVAQPPGKRLKSITMLSGGEKTLTAMALLFASFLIRPTPFCLLDEIDAPLDEENIGRFTAVLKDLAQNAQFLVITHNKRTMSIADSLFGVTMEEPGVSKLVSVRLGELQPA